ncbi:MAG: glycoside hydrolase family 31 protein [Spirochaetes bacterium]|nr:glycoside hydrolase family 31 protein [Spirochaetota bacterium]
MKLTTFKKATLSGHPPTLWFRGEGGEQFSLTVLDHHLVRFRFLPDGTPRLHRTWSVHPQPAQEVPLEGRSREDLSGFPCPPMKLECTSGGYTLTTQELTVEVQLDPFSLRWKDARGRVFAEDLSTKAYGYDGEGRSVFHYLRRFPSEVYYGLGERCGPLNKRGMRFRMMNLDALGYSAKDTDPLYKHWPFYITFLPEAKVFYGLFYDTPAVCEFDFGKELDAYHGDYRYMKAEEGDLDVYLIYGPDLPSVVKRFHLLMGGMTLPPRWSIGYLGSSMAYAESMDAQTQLLRFIQQCEEHRIPCHGFHLSSGYTLGENGKRYVFTWNQTRFPNPSALFKAFHDAGIRVVANIKPCLLTDHPSYREIVQKEGFLRTADGSGPEISMFWGGKGSYLDFTHPWTFQWWKQKVRESLLSKGIDGTWNDNNEYEVWDDGAQCQGFGNPFRVGIGRPVQTLLMVRASWEAQTEQSPDTRPFLISRSACPGVQRYAQTWSGDNSTSWETLKYNIPMGLGLSLSGFYNFGHDVGGFYGDEPDPELFLRWVQNGIFHPRFSIHSWHLDGTSNEPWMHPEVLPMVREAIRFRYRLIPYFYSLFYEAVRKGEPILRPMVYHFPQDPRCWQESFDFLLGPYLLVASVLEPGARTRTVYLPKGMGWYEVDTGMYHEGGKEIVLDAPLERIPLLAPEGALIPLGQVPELGREWEDTQRCVWVFPPRVGTRSRFLLIEDDGETIAYRKGEYTEVELSISAETDRIFLSAQFLTAGFPLPFRWIDFLLPPQEQRPVLGGTEVGKDPKGRRTIRVQLPLY